MALTFETVCGAAPASGYARMPFASTTLGFEQLRLKHRSCSATAVDLADPIKDAVTADGATVASDRPSGA